MGGRGAHRTDAAASIIVGLSEYRIDGFKGCYADHVAMGAVAWSWEYAYCNWPYCNSRSVGFKTEVTATRDMPQGGLTLDGRLSSPRKRLTLDEKPTL